jgi:hypothetical protein
MYAHRAQCRDGRTPHTAHRLRLAISVIAVACACGVAAAQKSPPATTSPAAPGSDGANPAVISTVLELFTSQGCSSCPPADELLKSYAGRPDVIALSLPVDYWDYLGWKDTLASAKNSERQRAYAKARGDGAVYTPQVVVNGLAHAVGSDRSQIELQIAKTAMKFADRRVPMRFWRTTSMIIVEVASAPDGAAPTEATIWLAPVEDTVEVEIERGENHGKTVKYANVVHEMTPIGTWTGKPMRIQLAAQPFIKPGQMRYAVLLQEGAAGPIIGATWLGY